MAQARLKCKSPDSRTKAFPSQALGGANSLQLTSGARNSLHAPCTRCKGHALARAVPAWPPLAP